MNIALKNKNIFITILSKLNVKFTEEYANRLYNEHPYKYSMFGLSRMLSEYNIQNAAIKIHDKQNAIKRLEVPFIAHIGFDFAVVDKITDKTIRYIWNINVENISIKEFCEIWTGAILYAEPDEKSIEPDYKKNVRKKRISITIKYTLFITFFLLLSIVFIQNQLYSNIKYVLLLLANFAGLYISYLLLLKQVGNHSQYADKICSIFSQNKCNDILQTDAAKLGGILSWSEIGMGYFASNILITIFFPYLVPNIALVNVLALPYTVWSIWYQKIKVKQWCPLCLIIQVLIWIIFIIDLGFGFLTLSAFELKDLFITVSVYIISILALNLFISNISDSEKMNGIIQEINSIKATNEVFEALLRKQPRYEVSKKTSQIVFGNPASEILVTIVTNPHCHPCAKMHERIERLLSFANNNLCIQYIFVSFHENLDSSNKFLIAVYLSKEDEREEIISTWFIKGKNDRENFFNLYNVDSNAQEVLAEFEKHEEWQNKSGLIVTPTILVNGYKLPDNYKIEDLKYFTRINL